MTSHYHHIIDFVKQQPLQSSKAIHEGIGITLSYATVKRIISKLEQDHILQKVGNGRGTKYKLSLSYAVISPVNMEEYFSQEIDERVIKTTYDFGLIPTILWQIELFTAEELNELNELQVIYTNNIAALTQNEYNNELERLAIDLSWKSSQIEGNTYSLLETERLLKEKLTADGKQKDEAIMLLNHKDAIDFIVDNPEYLNPLEVRKIEDIHSILIKELGVVRNIRKRKVGISGTNYTPLDNEFQIREALTQTCQLVNTKENVFEKALLLLVLLSYIQGFSDGNKRTARIVSNACLIYHQHCPLSFRTVDSIEYKKAMLLFYEQNNISAVKRLFIEQYKFAVNTYF